MNDIELIQNNTASTEENIYFFPSYDIEFDSKLEFKKLLIYLCFLLVKIIFNCLREKIFLVSLLVLILKIFRGKSTFVVC